MTYTQQAMALLKARGHRMTRPRQLVLETLEGAGLPLTAYQIAARVKEAGGVGDVVGVYRTLETLVQNDLVHRVMATGKFLRCELGPEDACRRHQLEHCHHHLVCRACDRIEEVHCPGLGLLTQALASQTSFLIEDHKLEFVGLCQDCQHTLSPH